MTPRHPDILGFSASVYEPVIQRQVATTNAKVPSVPVCHSSRVHDKYTAPIPNAKHVIGLSALPIQNYSTPQPK